MNETIITVVGNLTADPELRFTSSGAAVANFTVASAPRIYDRQSGEWKDGDALFLRCNIWREAAENVAESLVRGLRVIVTGGSSSGRSRAVTGRSAAWWRSTWRRSARRCGMRPRRSARSAAGMGAEPRSVVGRARGRVRRPVGLVMIRGLARRLRGRSVAATTRRRFRRRQ